MKIAIFTHDRRPGPMALAQGARTIGIEVLIRPPIFRRMVHPLAVHAVVTDGAKGDAAHLLDVYRSAQLPVWIMELPRLRTTPHAGFRALTGIHGLYYGSLHYLSPCAGNTGIVSGVLPECPPAVTLVCGQNPNDAAHGMNVAEVAAWSRETIALSRARYGYPVLYRPHPQTLAWFDRADTMGADEISWPSKETLRAALARSYALVTYNSTAGIEAIDAGVPAVYTAPRASVCWAPYGTPFGDRVTRLSPSRREEFLLRLAASQWTMAQLADGTAAWAVFQRGPLAPARLVTASLPEQRERNEELLVHARGIERRAARRRAFVEAATREVGAQAG